MKIMDKAAFEKENHFGLGKENTVYAQYFDGMSYLNGLTDPVCGLAMANVTFEPGCRNHWHIHHAKTGGGQMRILPEKAQQILDALHGGSNASYAIRYAAGFDEVVMVLSGMSDLAQMEDNLSYMESYKPLDEREMEAVRGVCDVFRSMHLIPCTACRYCTDGCPRHISIPDLFSCMNTKKIYNDWNADYYYTNVHTKNHGKASDCIGCGKCEKACPQHLPIRALLKDVAKEFEK